MLSTDIFLSRYTAATVQKTEHLMCVLQAHNINADLALWGDVFAFLCQEAGGVDRSDQSDPLVNELRAAAHAQATTELEFADTSAWKAADRLQTLNSILSMMKVPS